MGYAHRSLLIGAVPCREAVPSPLPAHCAGHRAHGPSRFGYRTPIMSGGNRSISVIAGIHCLNNAFCVARTGPGLSAPSLRRRRRPLIYLYLGSARGSLPGVPGGGGTGIGALLEGDRPTSSAHHHRSRDLTWLERSASADVGRSGLLLGLALVAGPAGSCSTVASCPPGGLVSRAV
jgi:hypothetical protein